MNLVALNPTRQAGSFMVLVAAFGITRRPVGLVPLSILHSIIHADYETALALIIPKQPWPLAVSTQKP